MEGAPTGFRGRGPKLWPELQSSDWNGNRCHRHFLKQPSLSFAVMGGYGLSIRPELLATSPVPFRPALWAHVVSREPAARAQNMGGGGDTEEGPWHGTRWPLRVLTISGSALGRLHLGSMGDCGGGGRSPEGVARSEICVPKCWRSGFGFRRSLVPSAWTPRHRASPKIRGASVKLGRGLRATPPTSWWRLVEPTLIASSIGTPFVARPEWRRGVRRRLRGHVAVDLGVASSIRPVGRRPVEQRVAHAPESGQEAQAQALDVLQILGS